MESDIKKLRNVVVLEKDIWIPMPDGTRLAARIWLPDDAAGDPVPALLEFLPYRKRDMTRPGDEPKHHYYAQHGYASVRVDMRGSGDSFGAMHDEYESQEQDDAVEVIAWLAAQGWCTGKVGMFGISWGGFNSLQVAARRPPALAAIITSCSTDDRYGDDVHYKGGCLLYDNMEWGTAFQSILALPGDPDIMGEGWHDNWMERLENIACPLDIWLGHQRRDAYWRHGSICEDYGDIQCAVFTVSGWLDGYTNAVFRLLDKLDVPRLGLVGPHGHQWGENPRAPGPPFGFLQEAVRWWDHWLKGKDTGIMDEPMLRAYMQEDIPADPNYGSARGRWVGETAWPSKRITERVLYLNDGTLDAAVGPETAPESAMVNASPQLLGLHAPKYSPYSTGDGVAEAGGDQRMDDGGAICFDGEILTETLEILGAPVVELELAVDRAAAFVAVRLSDVKPDGSVALASYGVLNLSHRDGHVDLKPMIPGQRTRIRVRLNETGYAFKPGHRIRVAVSTTFWPMIWPSPEPVTLTLFGGTGTLSLPVRPTGADEPALSEFGPPETGPAIKVEMVEPKRASSRVVHNVSEARTDVIQERHNGIWHFPEHGLTGGYWNSTERMSISEGDPLSAEIHTEAENQFGRDDFHVRARIRANLRSTVSDFILSVELDVFENGERFFSRNWTRRIPRDHI